MISQRTFYKQEWINDGPFYKQDEINYKLQILQEDGTETYMIQRIFHSYMYYVNFGCFEI